MATRYYFPDSATVFPPPVTPQFTTAWDFTNQGDRRAMTTSFAVSGSSQNLALSGSGVANTNVLRRQYIGPQIAEQTIAGTIKGQMRYRENTLADDCCAQIRAFVVDGTGAVIRGILFDVINTALTSEFATSLTNRKIPRSYPGTTGFPVTPVFTYNGDRIVIEIGMRQFSTTSALCSPAIQLSTSTGDLPQDETTTTALNPWVEFSADILAMTIVQRGSEMRKRVAKGKMMAMQQVPFRRYMFDNSSIYRKK